ncbi:response regulator [Candidatus Poribacteria bacterium]|nr:response regulator [Candidatus Poribacteria bacterium]
MKVLVVDDSAVMRKVIIGALSQAGFNDICQAADGQEAVTKVMAGDYGIVLMDWNMPNMSGLDALKAIRTNKSKVPIIMVTTEAEKSRIIDALKAGANNYIIKPFKPETIASKVGEVLAKASV